MASVKVCSTPGCPELRPCPTPGHEPRPWGGVSGATRRTERGVTVSGWDEQKRNRRTLAAHRHVCWWCKGPGATVIDHVVELADGGTDTDGNRLPIHPACHQVKTVLARAARARPA